MTSSFFFFITFDISYVEGILFPKIVIIRCSIIMEITCKNNFASILQNGGAKAAFQRANLNFKFLDETPVGGLWSYRNEINRKIEMHLYFLLCIESDLIISVCQISEADAWSIQSSYRVPNELKVDVNFIYVQLCR